MLGPPSSVCWFTNPIWLVVWNMNFIFPYIGNNNPTDETYIFQRVCFTTNQPWFLYFSRVKYLIFPIKPTGLEVNRAIQWTKFISQLSYGQTSGWFEIVSVSHPRLSFKPVEMKIGRRDLPAWCWNKTTHIAATLLSSDDRADEFRRHQVSTVWRCVEVADTLSAL